MLKLQGCHTVYIEATSMYTVLTENSNHRVIRFIAHLANPEPTEFIILLKLKTSSRRKHLQLRIAYVTS
jgi:hypothetical protein